MKQFDQQWVLSGSEAQFRLLDQGYDLQRTLMKRGQSWALMVKKLEPEDHPLSTPDVSPAK